MSKFMIETIYPYGSVNINEVKYIYCDTRFYYLMDKCGKWKINESTYEELKRRGIKEYVDKEVMER